MKLFANVKALSGLLVVGLLFAVLMPTTIHAQIPSGNLGGIDAYGNLYPPGPSSQFMNVYAWAFPGCFAPESAVSISIASPAVITVNNTCAAGQKVTFNSTGALPTGLTVGTTYYVIAAGLGSASFEVSTSAGGAAVNTSGTQSGTQTASSSYANKTASYTAAITSNPIPPNTVVPAHCSLIWQADNTSGAITLGLNVSNATATARVMSTMHYGSGGATLADLSTLIGAGSSYATPTGISASTTATAANTSYRADVDVLVNSGSTPATFSISALSNSTSYTVYLMPSSKCIWGQ